MSIICLPMSACFNKAVHRTIIFTIESALETVILTMAFQQLRDEETDRSINMVLKMAFVNWKQ